MEEFLEFPVRIVSGANEAPLETSEGAIATATATTAAVESTNADEILDDNDYMGIIDDDLLEDKVSQRKTPKYTALEAIENLLQNEANITRNIKAEAKKGLETYQRVQALSIVRYLQLIGEGELKMDASAKAVESFFPAIKAGKWSFKARSIRGWTAEYLVTGLLKKYQQGRFIKTSSVVTDENVQTVLLAILREMKDEDRHPESLRNYCNEILFKEVPNAPVSISLRTAARSIWDLNPKCKSKDIILTIITVRTSLTTVKMSSYLQC